MGGGRFTGGNALKYRITVGGHQQKVALPDSLALNAPLVCTIADKPVNAIWHRSLGVLTLLSADGVEQNIRVRSHQITRNDGEGESHIALEAWLKGVQSTNAVVTFDIAGLEGQTKKAASGQIIRSQMTGKVIKVLASPGESVKAGDTLIIIEAMKMENKIFSTASGKIVSVSVKTGDAVQTGKELMRITL
jgi:biotin carboxyl carrier protein